MKNNFILTVFVVFLFYLIITPYKVRATCNITNISGSSIEQESIDKCLTEQRRLDQQVRDQATSDSQNTQGLYKIKLAYFYKLDLSEKRLEAIRGPAIGLTSSYRLGNADCIQSMKIPSNPTTIDHNLFLSLIDSKDKCMTYLLKYKAITPITSSPTSVGGGGGVIVGPCPVAGGPCLPTTPPIFITNPTPGQTLPENTGCDSGTGFSSINGAPCNSITPVVSQIPVTVITFQPQNTPSTSTVNTPTPIIPKTEKEIAAPVLKTETKKATSTIIKIPEITKPVIETKENISNTTKLDQVNLDNKVIVTPEKTTHKSLWQKIKGWFGF